MSLIRCAGDDFALETNSDWWDLQSLQKFMAPIIIKQKSCTIKTPSMWFLLIKTISFGKRINGEP